MRLIYLILILVIRSWCVVSGVIGFVFLFRHRCVARCFAGSLANLRCIRCHQRERFSRAMRWTSGVRVLLPQVVTCFCIDSRFILHLLSIQDLSPRLFSFPLACPTARSPALDSGDCVPWSERRSASPLPVALEGLRPCLYFSYIK